MKKLVRFGLPKLFEEVGEDKDAAHSAGLFITALAHSRQRYAVMPARQTGVMVQCVFRYSTSKQFALCFVLGSFLLFRVTVTFRGIALDADGGLGYRQRGPRDRYLTVIFLGRNHFREQPIFGDSQTLLGHFNFVLQSAIGLVGFYRRRLALKFGDSILALLGIQLKFSAFLVRGNLCRFGLLNMAPSRCQSLIHCHKTAGKFRQLSTQNQELGILLLQLYQVFQQGMHGIAAF